MKSTTWIKRSLGVALCCGTCITVNAAEQDVFAQDSSKTRASKKSSAQKLHQRDFVDTGDGSLAPAEIIAACHDHAYMSDVRKECYEAGQKMPRDRAPEAIAACGDATAMDDGFRTCLAHVVKLDAKHTRAIKACDAITFKDEQMSECMSMAADFGHPAVGAVIEACTTFTYMDGKVPKCVAAAKLLSYDHAATVTACGKATYSVKSLVSCIEGAVR